ncbi:PCRF domain-containing protein [Patescibacteria group bacterium]|nr:PCRF domain-containing protein [Patescibacteria group bacterium]MBU1758280.1 PCRF domain-containing protein [Patescibacteria group bacterium]
MDPDTISDNQKAIQINREISNLQEIYDLTQDYKKYKKQYADAKEMLNNESDEDLLDMAKEDLKD